MKKYRFLRDDHPGINYWLLCREKITWRYVYSSLGDFDNHGPNLVSVEDWKSGKPFSRTGCDFEAENDKEALEKVFLEVL